jgi:hypothetical protein
MNGRDDYSNKVRNREIGRMKELVEIRECDGWGRTWEGKIIVKN